ncbi:peptide chain release factor N(5)-glutamine methyltransferase [Oceanimonas baumannii]|uniref:Release factor glutamine methyltransferase n=1 Tax=Oceanimonas baumannii TaxID=129578 RepID=A0A235CP34_9GAMM|nr:peptide chain release factor N(5)-glutamine methyltransferase [Oceanimonas baumannii]OYD26300.1 protein-(glutamine-N5) methyltransferase, release factor-specific [Oceanimonas baumannii]TDW62042.1 release factor glutamine methyltransferase [Oceanimonas baumannii]
MQLSELRTHLREQLAGGESPALDADVLLCHVLNKPRSFLLAWPEFDVSARQQAELAALISRRRAGEPVAHLTGQREFWTLMLEVTPDTLIPRPDTEILVEAALARLPGRPARVVDLGTGTGAIALSIKSERPADTVLAVEFSPQAAALARRNAARLELEVEVREGSWLAPLAGLTFDMIVSNPPYIDAADPHLAEGDVRFEPLSALVADDAGLADILHIAGSAPAHLVAGGWLLVEHGWQQGEAVHSVFTDNGFEQVTTLRDYGGQDRVTLGQWPGREHA